MSPNNLRVFPKGFIDKMKHGDHENANSSDRTNPTKRRQEWKG